MLPPALLLLALGPVILLLALLKRLLTGWEIVSSSDIFISLCLLRMHMHRRYLQHI